MGWGAIGCIALKLGLLVPQHRLFFLQKTPPVLSGGRIGFPSASLLCVCVCVCQGWGVPDKIPTFYGVPSSPQEICKCHDSCLAMPWQSAPRQGWLQNPPALELLSVAPAWEAPSGPPSLTRQGKRSQSGWEPELGGNSFQ